MRNFCLQLEPWGQHSCGGIAGYLRGPFLLEDLCLYAAVTDELVVLLH
jgi:hypothetical protein